MLGLEQIEQGVFDLVFTDVSDADADVRTLVYAVLGTDRRAPDYIESDGFEKRGCWDDPEAGTGLWWLRRQPLSDAVRAESIQMIKDALATKQPGLIGVDVAVVTPDQATGNISSVMLQITGTHNGREFIVNVPL